MKNIKNILAITFVAIAFMAKSQEREQLTVPLTDPNKEGKLNISIVTGSIKVVGYAGKEVVIDAVIKDDDERRGRRERGSSEGMKRINLNNGYEITAKEDNNVVKVHTDNPNRNVSFTVKVPQKFSIKLSTVNDGDIDVENVNGNIEVSNVNGHIKLKNIAGTATANTINEDIVVNFTDIAPNSPMAFTTLNGKVDVTLPANYKANVKVKSERGEVFSDFDIDIDKTSAKISNSADKEKGLYKLKKDDWTYGKINGGGAEILMKTMNGDVFIRKTK